MKKPTETPKKNETGIVISEPVISPIESLASQINTSVVSIQGLVKLGLSLAECEELHDVAKKHQLKFRHAKSIVRKLIVDGGIDAQEAQSAIEICLDGVSEGISCLGMVDIYLNTQGNEVAINEAIGRKTGEMLVDYQRYGGRRSPRRVGKVQDALGKPTAPPKIIIDDPENV